MGLFKKNCYTNSCNHSEVYHYSSRPPPAPTSSTVVTKKLNVTQRGRLTDDGLVEWTDKSDSGDEDDWSSPNPNPGMFSIKRIDSFRNNTDVFLVAEINYVGCTNYEGNKICVFKGISREELEEMKYLDPHFSETPFSPIARFKPDKDGWDYARNFVKQLL